MFSALLYLQYNSVKNRTVMRIKRLKQPKYLAGFIVGGLYLYFYFFQYVLRRPHPGLSLNFSPENRLLLEFGGAFVLFVIVFLAWIVPHQRAALTFTETEIAFLFPAPISRRGLIHFKLLRSQTAILFTTCILALVTNRLGGRTWIQLAAGWWLILSTLNLHFLGSSFALTRLTERGLSKWWRRVIILFLVAVAGGSVLIWARHTLPPFDVSKYSDLEGLKNYLQQVVTAGPVPYLLYPFRLVVRPYLAPNGAAFLVALPAALVLLALHYIWVVRSDVAFEEASIEASKRLAEKVAAIRAGNWQGAQRKPKRRRAPFLLRPTGPPAVALLWKNLISAGQIFTLRIWIALAIFAVFASVGTGIFQSDSGLRPIFGMIAGMLLSWSVIIGPQLMRQDFRQDLPMADILKTYPLQGWQIVVGELMAPAAILTCIQWFLLILVVGLFPVPNLTWPIKISIGVGAALVMPMINLITLQIPNAAVLLFPAWLLAGKGVSQGIEVTGQRLIFIFVQVFAFAVTLLPAGLVFAGIFFLVKMLALIPAILLASVAAAAVLAGEVVLGVILLGWLFKRFDVAAEQTA